MLDLDLYSVNVQLVQGNILEHTVEKVEGKFGNGC
jgi:hypothetical protein